MRKNLITYVKPHVQEDPLAMLLGPAYIGACLAFYRARSMYPDRPRPYKAPGGDGMALIMTMVCSAILGLSIVLFMYVPGEGFDWPVVVGSVVSILLGEVAIRYAEHERARSKT